MFWGFDGAGNFKEGFSAVKKDGKWGYINTKGEQIIECKFDDTNYFNEGFAAVKKDGKWGYINTKGEQIVECKFDGA
ncbi:MAG: WG repeat-containing protein, partial [Campylobacter concisus]|nr:WG repeat-containing protein [Campylobacter concisus]